METAGTCGTVNTQKCSTLKVSGVSLACFCHPGLRVLDVANLTQFDICDIIWLSYLFFYILFGCLSSFLCNIGLFRPSKFLFISATDRSKVQCRMGIFVTTGGKKMKQQHLNALLGCFVARTMLCMLDYA